MPRRRRRRRVRMELVIPHPVHGPLWWHIRRRRVQTAQSGLGVVLQTARPHVVSVLLTPPHIDESRVVRLSSSSFARSCFCVVSSFAPLYVNTDDDDVDDATTRVIKASTIILSLSLSLSRPQSQQADDDDDVNDDDKKRDSRIKGVVVVPVKVVFFGSSSSSLRQKNGTEEENVGETK